jgi:hypothetical protein
MGWNVAGSDQANYLKCRSNDEQIALFMALDCCFCRANRSFKKGQNAKSEQALHSRLCWACKDFCVNGLSV